MQRQRVWLAAGHVPSAGLAIFEALHVDLGAAWMGTLVVFACVFLAVGALHVARLRRTATVVGVAGAVLLCSDALFQGGLPPSVAAAAAACATAALVALSLSRRPSVAPSRERLSVILFGQSPELDRWRAAHRVS
jgi:hypothetical protein